MTTVNKVPMQKPVASWSIEFVPAPNLTETMINIDVTYKKVLVIELVIENL